MSNATELASLCVEKTDKKMTEVHSGFVPMASLTEVLTRNTLVRSCTIESCLEMDGDESSADVSRDTSQNVSRDPSRDPSPVR